MTDSLVIAAVGCFSWGIVSVLFSPCHLASIPLVVGYVAGQGKIIQGREAAKYAVAFSFGLFVTIAAIGVICSLLGRMRGDVWTGTAGQSCPGGCPTPWMRIFVSPPWKMP